MIGFPTIALPVLTKEQVPSSNNDTSLLSQTVFLNEDEASAFVYMYPLIGCVTTVDYKPQLNTRWTRSIRDRTFWKKKLIENQEMVFKNGVINIQAWVW